MASLTKIFSHKFVCPEQFWLILSRDPACFCNATFSSFLAATLLIALPVTRLMRASFNSLKFDELTFCFGVIAHFILSFIYSSTWSGFGSANAYLSRLRAHMLSLFFRWYARELAFLALRLALCRALDSAFFLSGSRLYCFE